MMKTKQVTGVEILSIGPYDWRLLLLAALSYLSPDLAPGLLNTGKKGHDYVYRSWDCSFKFNRSFTLKVITIFGLICMFNLCNILTFLKIDYFFSFGLIEI